MSILLACLMVGRAYTKRQVLRSRVEVWLEYKEHLENSRQLQDSMLQSLHIMILRFHSAVETASTSEPATKLMRAELDRAELLMVDVQRRAEELSVTADPAKHQAAYRGKTGKWFVSIGGKPG